MKYKLKCYRWCFIFLHRNLLECLIKNSRVFQGHLLVRFHLTQQQQRGDARSLLLLHSLWKMLVFSHSPKLSLPNTVCGAYSIRLQTTEKIKADKETIQYESVCLACDYWCGNVYRHCKGKHLINKLIYLNCLLDDRCSLSTQAATLWADPSLAFNRCASLAPSIWNATNRAGLIEAKWRMCDFFCFFFFLSVALYLIMYWQSLSCCITSAVSTASCHGIIGRCL